MPLFPKLILLSLLSTAPVFAQQHYTANKIVFKHPGGFSQADLEAASGFHHGTAFTVDDLTAAAQKLSDTAYFDNVGAAVDGGPNAMTVIFDLTPSPASQFLPVGFENFVWLSRDEIVAALRKQMPLYNGTVPESGVQVETINSTLKSLLAAKGVSARIEHETLEPTLEHPARVIDFRVRAPFVVVSNVKIAAPVDVAPLLSASLKNVVNKPYDDGLAGTLTTDALLGPIRNAGYLKASLGSVTFDPLSTDGDKVPLVLHAALTPGGVYRLGSLNFAGAPLYSAESFAKTATLHTGDVAAQNKLIETLAPIDIAYRSKGYADVIVAATPTFDDAAKTVSYTITVTPGEVYRIKSVSAQGLDSKAQADFEKYFLMREGEPFNQEYTNGFVKNNTALASLRDYAGNWRAVSSPTTHTVDLTVVFFKGGSLQQKVVVH